ncbi:MAG: hypothetical protein IJ881_10235, partial [Neisseriaceae bacterium]|nr:hypothetical protein [Neisseriaceae bacterium]
PALEESSKVLQLLYHRLLDSVETELRLSTSGANTFATGLGLSSWVEMEKILKKDIRLLPFLIFIVQCH